MIQFYLLSVLCNGAAGWLLLRNSENTLPAPPPFRLVLGALTAVVGLVKLVSPMDTPVIGDLIPALAALAAAGVILFEYWRENAPSDSSTLVEVLVAVNRRRIGFLAASSAVAHFLFPQTPLI
ncbi:MAG: hypothetical protein LBD13_03715 [Spirochaetaceae bacterium]|jgi:hypothetical protein|nr:hypothetical protein [Spirochaetaceae bacterium]